MSHELAQLVEAEKKHPSYLKKLKLEVLIRAGQSEKEINKVYI